MQTLGEQRIRELVEAGDRADLSDLPEIERQVPAGVLTELLQSTAHARLVQVTGAHFVGRWDLEHLTCETPVRLMSCRFDTVPVLRFASLPALAFEDCDLPGLEGERLQITHHLELIASRVDGTVHLAGASVGGRLACIGTTVRVDTGESLVLNSAEIKGDVALMSLVSDNRVVARMVTTTALERVGTDSLRCTISGEVTLLGARIGGELICQGVTLTSADGTALNARRAEITGGILLSALDRTDADPLPCTIRGLAQARDPSGCGGQQLTASHQPVTGP